LARIFGDVGMGRERDALFGTCCLYNNLIGKKESMRAWEHEDGEERR
jgi:hypothetical protein